MAKEAPKKFVTPPFVTSFPALFEAKEGMNGGPPKYGVTAIWTPANFTERDKVLYRAILAELDAVSKQAFGKPWKELPGNIKRGIRDGAEKDLDGYGPGTRFANMTSNRRPGVIDIRENKIDDPEEIFAGCIGRATVNIYAYDKNGGKGVALGLRNYQLIKNKDVERLDGGGGDASGDFDEQLDSSWLDGAEDFADGDMTDDIPF